MCRLSVAFFLFLPLMCVLKTTASSSRNSMEEECFIYRPLFHYPQLSSCSPFLTRFESPMKLILGHCTHKKQHFLMQQNLSRMFLQFSPHLSCPWKPPLEPRCPLSAAHGTRHQSLGGCFLVDVSFSCHEMAWLELVREYHQHWLFHCILVGYRPVSVFGAKITRL